MSDEPTYNPLVIRAWTALSLLVSVSLFAMLALGQHLLHAGYIVWSLIRWIFSPII